MQRNTPILQKHPRNSMLDRRMQTTTICNPSGSCESGEGVRSIEVDVEREDREEQDRSEVHERCGDRERRKWRTSGGRIAEMGGKRVRIKIGSLTCRSIHHRAIAGIECSCSIEIISPRLPASCAMRSPKEVLMLRSSSTNWKRNW